jgi:hypothetical protein
MVKDAHPHQDPHGDYRGHVRGYIDMIDKSHFPGKIVGVENEISPLQWEEDDCCGEAKRARCALGRGRRMRSFLTAEPVQFISPRALYNFPTTNPRT